MTKTFGIWDLGFGWKLGFEVWDLHNEQTLFTKAFKITMEC